MVSGQPPFIHRCLMTILERNDTYFPIKIVIVATGQEIVVLTPEQLPRGVSLKILETKVAVK